MQVYGFTPEALWELEGSHKYTDKRFPSHEGGTDFTDFERRVDFIHIAFQISKEFHGFLNGVYFGPIAFLWLKSRNYVEICRGRGLDPPQMTHRPIL